MLLISTEFVQNILRKASQLNCMMAWLPTLHLGHEKRVAVMWDDGLARYERTKETEKELF